MWDNMLSSILDRLVVDGRLAVVWPDGRQSVFGPGGDLAATVRILDQATVRRLCLTPELALGEGYMSGEIEVAPEELPDLMRLLVRNRRIGVLPPWVRAAQKVETGLRTWMERNTPQTARRNVAHHYDISNDLYRLFLDEDMQYSCAYFARPGLSLEAAQRAKKRHIAAKLLIEPGMHVLDIGCGWGGMALTLAQEYGARVTGVTLSENQLRLARARARDAGLEDRVRFELMDYRKLSGPFDRIVSVGMLEHVGSPHIREYFARVHDLLAPDGVALIHTIGICQPPRATSRWLRKYIFPGGYIPSMSDIGNAVERAGFWLADWESWRWHYAETLRHWRERFEGNLDTVREMYDDRFIRMWRYYLVACETAFLEQQQVVFQVQLARRRDAVPVTRDYLYEGASPERDGTPPQPGPRREAAE